MYFSYHAKVRLRFKIAAGLGEAWTRAGGIPQGCRLSMVFIVALCSPWCRYFSDQHGVISQLYADNLKCTTTDGQALLLAARFTDQYIRAVGQEASPGKCVLFSTSETIGRRKKIGPFLLEFNDVRDFGGHLDITLWPRAGTLSRKAVQATSQVQMVGVFPFGFLHLLDGAEGADISCKNLKTFRTGIVRACWPEKLLMANHHAVLSLLDAPDCCDLALYVIWVRFRQMRRFLAYRLNDVPRIHGLLDLAAACRPGHGPVEQENLDDFPLEQVDSVSRSMFSVPGLLQQALTVPSATGTL